MFYAEARAPDSESGKEADVGTTFGDARRPDKVHNQVCPSRKTGWQHGVRVAQVGPPARDISRPPYEGRHSPGARRADLCLG